MGLKNRPLRLVRPLAEGDLLPTEDRLERGSALALEMLYTTQAPRLSRFFGRRAAWQDVGDLVHESFARLADAASDPDRRIDQPEAYLNQIARNVLRNRAKSALQRSLSSQVPIDDVVVPGSDAIASLGYVGTIPITPSERSWAMRCSTS